MKCFFVLIFAELHLSFVIKNFEEIVVSQHQYCVTTILAGLALGIFKKFPAS